MKRTFSFAAFLFIVVMIYAIPAKRVTKIITLTNGTKINVTLKGDEFYHYWQDANGICYEQLSDGLYTAVSKEESARRTKRAKEKSEKSNRRRKNAPIRHGAKFIGNKNGLVILVNFQDEKMIYTQADFNDAFNKSGYKINGYGIGSVRDYFLAQSYNQLSINFDVVGPVTVSKKMADYGRDDNGEGNDIDAAGMVVEALKLADKDVDYRKYDWNNDGEVDQVYVVYAGYGQAQGAPANTIWPHEWSLQAAGKEELVLDGMRIDTYACSNELQGSPDLNITDEKGKPMIDGIGTACHEFSHCLGFPDMYDTSTGNNYGMGNWDLMCGGSYNGMSFVPAGYSSYERMEAGWLTPTELKEFTSINEMPAISRKPTAYIIYNQANQNEYYLLENRQPEGWDKELPGKGMLILHVDYDQNAWFLNEVNNIPSHQRLTIIPADGLATERTEEQDTWPQTGKTELTNTSSPAAKLYNNNIDGKKLLNFPIRNITQNANGTISFTAGEKHIPTPIALPATQITNNSFTANWQNVEGANSYRIVLTGSKTSNKLSTLLSEDFSNLRGNRDASQDISSSINSYTKESGWTGVHLYKGQYGLKIGNSQGGSLTTPKINTMGDIIVRISARVFNKDNNSLTISLSDGQTQTINLSAEETTTTLSFKTEGEINLTLNPAKRAYLSGLIIEGGKTERQEKITMDTSIVFSELDSTQQYSYVVYALTNEGESKASNIIHVTPTTDILAPDAANTHNPIYYDLSGRKIIRPTQRGIYILGGKKYINPEH